MDRSLKVALLAVASLTVALPVDACTMLPQTPLPPVPWFTDKGLDTVTGLERVAVGIDLIGLFGPLTTTFCQCGTTFINGVAIPHNVTDAYVTISNPITHQDLSRVIQFDQAFAQPNATTTNVLNTLAPSPNWTGFGGTVQPFTPALPPGDIFKLWFDYEVPVAQVQVFESSTFYVGAGSWDPVTGNGDPSHPLVIQPTPEPGTVGMLASGGIGLLMLAYLRRRAL